MVRKWITWTNYAAGGIIALLLVSTAVFYMMRQKTFSIDEREAKRLEVPQGAFQRTPEEYETIDAPALTLNFSPLSIQLPDLRRHLLYYGKNGRPDAKNEQQALFFSFTGNKVPTSLFSGSRLYLLYDKKQIPPQYVFSENNVPTPIWMEASAQGNHALVKVSMEGENGQIIREPAAYADFSLPEKEFVRFGGATWELGNWRVDGTLLARQKARWYGIDKFLEKHGGEEYNDLLDKQRIDFGDADDIYSTYVGAGDCLIWDGKRWEKAQASESSLNYVLMCVKKIDERIMSFELWDVDGKGKITLNLVKVNEAWSPQNLEQNFKFVGARTRSQFVFEIGNNRMILRPHDWLILTEGTWKKLTTPSQIDDYVERRLVGPLFVFDRVERKEDRQVIIATLFNAARTETVTFELPLQQVGSAPGSGGHGDRKQKTKESNHPSMLKTGIPAGVKSEQQGMQRPNELPRPIDDEQD